MLSEAKVAMFVTPAVVLQFRSKRKLGREQSPQTKPLFCFRPNFRAAKGGRTTSFLCAETTETLVTQDINFAIFSFFHPKLPELKMQI